MKDQFHVPSGLRTISNNSVIKESRSHLEIGICVAWPKMKENDLWIRNMRSLSFLICKMRSIMPTSKAY